MHLDAFESELGIGRNPVELGIHPGEPRIERGELHRSPRLDQKLFEPALDSIESALDSIETHEQPHLLLGDLVHAGLDTLQHGFETSVVSSGHEGSTLRKQRLIVKLALRCLAR